MMYYSAAKYDSAIVEYEKIRDREKELIKYNKYFWYVAYDNLSDSYIRTNNPDTALEICKRGLKRDKKYPMFYYTMARIYAEKGDKGLMLDNLRKAYKYKENMLLGEPLPNPLENDSFQEMLKVDGVRKEFEKLVQ
jgi:tetratricopeptide (TPR) repeat protein